VGWTGSVGLGRAKRGPVSCSHSGHSGLKKPAFGDGPNGLFSGPKNLVTFSPTVAMPICCLGRLFHFFLSLFCFSLLKGKTLLKNLKEKKNNILRSVLSTHTHTEQTKFDHIMCMSFEVFW